MMIRDSRDLRARIHELAQETPDPLTVTRRILFDLTGEEAKVIAGLTLNNYVRLQMTARPSDRKADLELYDTPTGHSPSAFVAGVRTWLDDELGRSVCVDSRARMYKRFADCTRDDLLAASASRKAAAKRLEERSRTFLRTAMALDANQAETVRDLPREVLEELLAP